MSGHTPGPWVAIPLRKRIDPFATDPHFVNGLWAICEKGVDDRLPIAVLDHADDHHAPTRRRAEADARLIAEAPALLAALVDLLYEDSDKSEQERLNTRTKAALAIAKAQGE